MFGSKPKSGLSSVSLSTSVPTLTVTDGDVHIKKGDLYIGDKKVDPNGTGFVLPDPLEVYEVDASIVSTTSTITDTLNCMVSLNCSGEILGNKIVSRSDVEAPTLKATTGLQTGTLTATNDTSLQNVQATKIDATIVNTTFTVTESLTCMGELNGNKIEAISYVKAPTLIATTGLQTGTLTATSDASLQKVQATEITCQKVNTASLVLSGDVSFDKLDVNNDLKVGGGIDSKSLFGSGLVSHPPTLSLTWTPMVSYPTVNWSTYNITNRKTPKTIGTKGLYGVLNIPPGYKKKIDCKIPVAYFGWMTDLTMYPWRFENIINVAFTNKAMTYQIYKNTSDSSGTPFIQGNCYWNYYDYSTATSTTYLQRYNISYNRSPLNDYWFEMNSWYVGLSFTPSYEGTTTSYYIYLTDGCTYNPDFPQLQSSLCFSLPMADRLCFKDVYYNDQLTWDWFPAKFNPATGIYLSELQTTTNIVTPGETVILPLAADGISANLTGVTDVGSLNVLKNMYCFGQVKLPTGQAIQYFNPNDLTSIQITNQPETAPLDSSTGQYTDFSSITIDSLSEISVLAAPDPGWTEIATTSVKTTSVTAVGSVTCASLNASGSVTCASLNAGSGSIQTTGNVTTGDLTCKKINCTSIIGGSGTLVVGGGVSCTSVNAGSGAVQTTGSVSSGAISCTSLNAGSGTVQTTGNITSGSIVCTSLNAGSGSIQTTGLLTAGAITCSTLTSQPKWTSGWTPFSLLASQTNFTSFTFTHNLNLSFTPDSFNLPIFKLYFTQKTSGTPSLTSDIVYEVSILFIYGYDNSYQGAVLTHTSANTSVLTIAHRLYLTPYNTFTTVVGGLVGYKSAESGMFLLVAN